MSPVFQQAVSGIRHAVTPIKPKAVQQTLPLTRLQKPSLSKLKLGIQKQLKNEPLLFWMGMTGLPAAILTPITTFFDLKHKPEITEKERHLLVTQEIIRQTVSALTYWISYYGSIVLIGLQLKEKTPNKSLKQLLGATLVSTIGTGLLRPIITNAFLAKHARKEQLQSPATNPFQKYPLPSSAFRNQEGNKIASLVLN